jgi:riboflavin biosynthesis pyrimidine reductase
MRALLPEPSASVDVADAYAIPAGAGTDRPFVRCNMISSLDGAIAVDGRSGMLGGPADGRLFQVLRSLADVILVGAGTARAEGYGPVRLSEELRQQRRQREQSAVPPIAVVTRSANFDWSSPLFAEAEARTIVITTSDSDKAERSRGEDVADFVLAGDGRVDPRRAIDHFHRVGYRSVLLEGGPGLNDDVLRAGLLDELCLTLAPRLVAGSGSRVLAGEELHHPLELDIVHLLEEDGLLFYRLAVPSGRRPR